MLRRMCVAGLALACLAGPATPQNGAVSPVMPCPTDAVLRGAMLKYLSYQQATRGAQLYGWTLDAMDLSPAERALLVDLSRIVDPAYAALPPDAP